MADTFVKMVEFRSTGLEQIELGLKKAVVSSESAVTAGKAYQKVLDSTLRTLPSMTRIFEAGVRVQKESARTLGEVARAQDRVNAASAKGAGGLRYSGAGRAAGATESGAVGRMIATGVDKFQRAITATVRSFGDIVRGFRGGADPFGRPASPGAPAPSVGQRIGGGLAGLGGAAAVAGTVAGAAAGTGLALGVSGLSGTVPMARLNNQIERFTWELGNTLTPFVDILTKKVGQANTWLSRQPQQTQDAIGTGLAVGGTAAAAQVASRSLFGVGLGGIAGGVGGALFGLGRAALMGAPAAAPTAAQSLYATTYGSQGLPQAANAAGGFLGRAGAFATRLAAPLAIAGAGISGGVTTIRGKGLESEAQEIGKGKTDTSHLDEYRNKFSGLSGDALNKAVEVERQKLLKEDIAGTKNNDIGFFGAIWRSAIPGVTSYPGKEKLNENEMRRNALAEIAGERKPGGGGAADHRANALVGGTFGEVGSGYYAAASELAKTGYDAKTAGGDNAILGVLLGIAGVIQQAADKQNQEPLK